MFKTTPTVRLLLHVANLTVIFFILLPLVAVFIGSIQSERALQADTRRVLPLEVTLDNFTVILTKGQQRGRIFDQATYLPDNIKSFYTAFMNSMIVAGSVTLLTLLFGSLSAYTIARQRFRWTLFLMQANIVARFVPVIVLMIPLYVVMRSVGQLNSLSGVIIAEHRFSAALRDPDPGALLRHHPDRTRGSGAHRWLHAARRLLPHRRAAGDAGAGGLRCHHVHHLLA